MIIHIGSGGELTLVDPDEFGDFHAAVQTPGPPLGERLSRQGQLTVLDDDHVSVDPALIRALAADRADDPQWNDSLSAMLAFAERHGWIDAAGRVRAHIEAALAAG